MKLYDMPIAPNPRRVNIFLAEKGIDIPRVQIDLRNKENLTDEFLKRVPRGMVPALELDDGTIIDESVAICRYIEELHPQPPLMGTDPLSKANIESWQRHMEFDGLLALADLLRNSAPPFAKWAVAGVREEFNAIPELAERGKRRLVMFFDNLNDRLRDNEYVAGEAFSIADITAFCTVDLAHTRDMENIGDREHLQRWYDQVSKRPSIST